MLIASVIQFRVTVKGANCKRDTVQNQTIVDTNKFGQYSSEANSNVLNAIVILVLIAHYNPTTEINIVGICHSCQNLEKKNKLAFIIFRPILPISHKVLTWSSCVGSFSTTLQYLLIRFLKDLSSLESIILKILSVNLETSYQNKNGAKNEVSRCEPFEL